MPKEMAHSHLGMVTDGRYIYVVTGQYGPQCRGPTAHTFVLDTKTKKWSDLPHLPFPRCVLYQDFALYQEPWAYFHCSRTLFMKWKGLGIKNSLRGLKVFQSKMNN